MSLASICRSTLIWIAPLAVLTVSAFLVWRAEHPAADPALERELALYRQVRQLILERYVAPVEAEELLYGALEGMTAPLDPHSRFQDPKRFAEFRKSTEGVIRGGIGVRIRSGATGVEVITPLWGTPALEAGILPGDLIVAIDGQPTAGLDNEAVSAILGGSIGTSVALEIKREGHEAPLAMVVERADIELESVAQIGFAGEGIGYIRLTSFQEDSGKEVKGAIKRLETAGARALILDLRSNLGGRLSAATEIADLFLDDGVIVTTEARDPGESRTYAAHREGTLPDYPLVLLVDNDSASASEVLAGALQDHQRGLVLGARTWGKGSVQELFPLDGERAALKLTTKRYRTPSGRSLHREPDARVWGVIPDVIIELDESERDRLGELWLEAEIVHGGRDLEREHPMVDPGHDRQLDAAVAVLEGVAVDEDPITHR